MLPCSFNTSSLFMVCWNRKKEPENRTMAPKPHIIAIKSKKAYPPGQALLKSVWCFVSSLMLKHTADEKVHAVCDFF